MSRVVSPARAPAADRGEWGPDAAGRARAGLPAVGFELLQTVHAWVQALPGPWGFAGGWGIDAWLGRVTRHHKDVDLAILRRHQLAWQAALLADGWTLAVAHHGKLNRWVAGEPIELPLHVAWAKKPGVTPDFIELLLNDDDGEQLAFRRASEIRLPLGAAFVGGAAGLPVLAPELILLFKAKKHAEGSSEKDFEAVFLRLPAPRRAWLAEALGTVHPGHPWRARLLA